MDEGRYSIEQSRSVRSVWGWRALLLMSMVAVGIAIILAGNHDDTLAILWLVIAVGWFAISMWVWRMHVRYVNGGGS
jgi:hypothetical protein